MNPVADDSSVARKGAPEWALRACESFIAQTEKVQRVLQLCMRGLQMTTNLPMVVSVLAKTGGTLDTEEYKAELERAEKVKGDASKEINAGFPTLHSQATVALWGSLESMAKDLVSDWLCNKPEILNHELWANLKVRLGDYHPLDTEQRADYLVDLADLNASAPLKQGVTRFERLFETIGLNGAVPENTRKVIFELQQIRNVLVHRQGYPDQRFSRACPWIQTAPGEPVQVDAQRFAGYLAASLAYTTELIFRTGEFFGVEDVRTLG